MGLLVAPIDGRIVEVFVSVGDKVEIDDEMLILEALKMENPICTDKCGQVVEVRVKKGDEVKEDQILVIIE
ncbi:MAG: biotin/lipoyl-containing protein [Bacillota bacterium]|nr:biotin/lipoyl-containing protein [Bacillota bacterium]